MKNKTGHYKYSSKMCECKNIYCEHYVSDFEEDLRQNKPINVLDFEQQDIINKLKQ